MARRPGSGSAWSGAGVGEGRPRGPRVRRREVPGAPSPVPAPGVPSGPLPQPGRLLPGCAAHVAAARAQLLGRRGAGQQPEQQQQQRRPPGSPAPRRPGPPGPCALHAARGRRGAGAGAGAAAARAAGSGVHSRAGGGRRGAGPGRKFHIGSLIPGQPRPARRQRPPRAPDPTLRPCRRPSARPPPPGGRAQTWGELGRGPRAESPAAAPFAPSPDTHPRSGPCALPTRPGPGAAGGGWAPGAAHQSSLASGASGPQVKAASRPLLPRRGPPAPGGAVSAFRTGRSQSLQRRRRPMLEAWAKGPCRDRRERCPQ